MAKALVLSAGGMFAAWEVGVWKALESRYRPDAILGASAGAWLAWAIAGGATAADLEREYLDPLTAEIMKPGLHRSGCLRPDAMHAKARDLFDRYRPRVPVAFTLVELPTLRVRLVRDRAITWKHLAAACTVPLCFPPIEIDGRRYIDGGLRSSLPLWGAEELGCDRAVAMNCLTALPFRLFRLITRPRRPSARLGVDVIEPSRPLGSLYDAVFWKASNIERWIAQGVEDGNRSLTRVRM